MIDLKGWNTSISVNAASFFFAFVAPGFLIFFLLKPQLFVSLDFWKLLILAPAITAPPFLVTLLFAAAAYLNLLKKHPEYVANWGGPHEWFLRLSFNNSMWMFSIALLIWVFNFSVKGYVISVGVVMFSNLVSETYYFIRFVRDPQNFDYEWFKSIWSFLDRQ